MVAEHVELYRGTSGLRSRQMLLSLRGVKAVDESHDHHHHDHQDGDLEGEEHQAGHGLSDPEHDEDRPDDRRPPRARCR